MESIDDKLNSLITNKQEKPRIIENRIVAIVVIFAACVALLLIAFLLNICDAVA